MGVILRSAGAFLATGPTTAREAGADTTQARRAALLDMLGGSASEDSEQSSDSVEFAVEALVALKQDRSVSAGSLVSVTSRRHSKCALRLCLPLSMSELAAEKTRLFAAAPAGHGHRVWSLIRAPCRRPAAKN